MNQYKLRLMMVALLFVLLCLLVVCIMLRSGTFPQLQPNETSDGTQSDTLPANTGSTAPVIPSVSTTVTIATVPTTLETTEETTESTTEATTVPETTVAVNLEVGEKVAELARQQVGKLYQYGYAGPDTFDTSGLVYFCYGQVEIEVPRSNGGLASFGYEITKEELQPGDGVFFWSKTPGDPEFLGIYVGDGKVVISMNPERNIVEIDMNSNYYTEHYVFSRRFY